MVQAGTLCRNQVNRYTGYIKRIFAWGVEEEIVQANVIHALRTVKDLKAGTPGTFDHPELRCPVKTEGKISIESAKPV